MKFKSYDSLTFSDNFMFCKILYSNKELCREFIETLLQIQIHHIEYSGKEHSVKNSFSSKGIRMDVYVKDSDRVFDLEMQTSSFENLPFRVRYYQSMIDSSNLEEGNSYEQLPESYIIFICLNDPFDRNIPVYDICQYNRLDKSFEYKDKTHKLFYNCSAFDFEKNQNIKDLLNFIKTNRTSSNLTRRLKDEVSEAIIKDIWRSDYMIQSLWETDARKAGKIEGILSGKLEAAKNLITLGVDMQTVVKATGLTEEQILAFIKENQNHSN